MLCRFYFLLLFLSCVQQCLSYRILCLFPYPGKSHHTVFEPLFQELSRRGHELTVVSFFPSNNTNRRDVSLKNLAPVSLEVVDLNEFEDSYSGFNRYYTHIPHIMRLAQSNLDLCEKLLNSPVMQEFVKGEGSYDLILVEHFNSDCMMGIIHVYNLPSVGVMSCAMLPWTPSRVGVLTSPASWPEMILGLTDIMSFMERIENTFVHFYLDWLYETTIRRKEQILLERILGKSLPPLVDIAKKSSVILVNTHYSLNGVRATPPAIVEIGGMHLHNHVKRPLPDKIERWLAEAPDGVILLSFGSLIRGSTLPARHIDTLFRVFSRLRQRVLWKWEDDNLHEVPKNVMVSKWLPQYDLLNHPKCVAFMNHGGLSSLTEGVAAGVPMLTMPILGDQFGNAAHAVRAGIAVSLPVWEMSESNLYNVLQQILSPHMRQKAKEFREEWHDRIQTPIETAVYWVERAARRNKSEQSTSLRHLPMYQILLIDVFLVYILIVIIFISGVYYCLRSLCRKICKALCKVKKS